MTNGTGRGWWAPPKGTHVSKLKLNDKGRALFNKVLHSKKDYSKGEFVEICPINEQDEHTRKALFSQFGDYYYNDQINTLNKKEQNAVRTYVQAALINFSLRNGHDLRSKKIVAKNKELISLIDSSLNKSNIPHNIKIFRGTNREFFKNISVGDIIIDKGYVSCTIDRNVAERMIPYVDNPEGNAFFVINAKKGQKGLYVGNAKFNDGNNETPGAYPQRELILPRNCKFKIKSITEKKGNKRKYIEIEVDLLQRDEADNG